MKTILVTGSTDGIGLETAKRLAEDGHNVLMHGRNTAKLDAAIEVVSGDLSSGAIEGFVVDLSKMADVNFLAEDVKARFGTINVLINNAGVFKTSNPFTHDGLDIRYVVNAIAPYLLTQELLPILKSDARVVNVSSAAQAPVDFDALFGRKRLQDMDAYSQSKLALTMWSNALANKWANGPIIFSVNPGSLLATKMVREGFGVAGNDTSIGANILTRAALSQEFELASGKYFDNDAGRFASPHPDALDLQKCEEIVCAIEEVLKQQIA